MFGCIGREEVENWKMDGSCGFERKIKKWLTSLQDYSYTLVKIYIKKSSGYFVKLLLIIPNESIIYNLQKNKIIIKSFFSIIFFFHPFLTCLFIFTSKLIHKEYFLSLFFLSFFFSFYFSKSIPLFFPPAPPLNIVLISESNWKFNTHFTIFVLWWLRPHNFT